MGMARGAGRAVRGLVLALVLVFFAVSPMVEGLVCAADEVSGTAVANALTVAPEGGRAPASQGSEKSSCPHGGHCHQTSMAELLVTAFLSVRHGQPATHAASDALQPPSRPPASLDRPPRA